MPPPRLRLRHLRGCGRGGDDAAPTSKEDLMKLSDTQLLILSSASQQTDHAEVLPASAVGRPVEVHAYADRIVIRQDGRTVAEHPRSFGRRDSLRPLALCACARSQTQRLA